MTFERREFLKLGALAGTAALAHACRSSGADARGAERPDPALEELAEAALGEARRLGASYADWPSTFWCFTSRLSTSTMER